MPLVSLPGHAAPELLGEYEADDGSLPSPSYYSRKGTLR